MRSILQEFRIASARERLSIVSDCTSIIGVSLVAVVSPFAVFSNLRTLEIGILVACVVLVQVAVLSLLLVGTQCLAATVGSRVKGGASRALVQGAIWLLFVALVLFALGTNISIMAATKW